MTISAEHHQEKTLERDDAVAAIQHTLNTIEAEYREPDVWGRTLLAQAIGWLFRGGYRPAAVQADLALTPVNQRGQSPHIKIDSITS